MKKTPTQPRIWVSAGTAQPALSELARLLVDNGITKRNQIKKDIYEQFHAHLLSTGLIPAKVSSGSVGNHAHWILTEQCPTTLSKPHLALYRAAKNAYLDALI